MHLVLILLFALSCSPIVCAQATGNKKTGNSAHRTKAETRLQLTTSVTDQVFCAPENLVLGLRLTFRNIGKEPVILNKRILFGGLMVSRDLKAAAARKYETSLRYDLFGGDESESGLNPPTDLSNFVILSPGEQYELADRVSVWTNDVTPQTGNNLRDGTHFLQIEVGTWPYIIDPKPYHKKWKGKGFLWSQGLTSQPMPFTVMKDRQIIKCS